MEAPGEDELEWMALQQQHEEDELLQEDFFHQIEEGFENPVSRGGFEAADSEIPQDSDEPSIQNVEDAPVKRKILVFPDQLPVLDVSLKKRKVAQALVDDEKLHEAEPEKVPEAPENQNLDVHGEKLREQAEEPDVSVLESSTSVSEEQKLANFPHLRAADIAGDFIPVTGPSGERVYAEVNRHSFSTNVIHPRREGPLLSESVDKLIESLERQHLERVLSENAPETTTSAPSLDKSHKLWVDKYAPSSFTDLLSDEKINREVLSWLKQWDPCVFGAQTHSTPKEVILALRQHKNDSKFNRKGGETPNATTSGDRPAHKALLLCGPPGLGKTTLAHVAAKHCGYRVVEINASDDRTSTSLQTKILDAIQMKPMTGDSKPNCLIIDEIDGACIGAEGKSAISFLLDLINTESRDESSNRFKKKTKHPQLSRPVICICNDLYAPALRPLRQHARIHVFTAPSPHRIVTRLKHICKMEDYKVTDRALTSLAVYTESDVRSCLNTLQFLHQRGHVLNPLDLGSQVIGRKDMTSSFFDIWVEMFFKRRTRATEAANRGQMEFNRLHDIFTNHGEYELGMDGVFENFLNMRYHDAYLQKTIKCLDLIAESDIFGHRTISRHQFFMNNYRASLNLGIRGLIAQPIRPSIEWPKALQRCKQVHVANSESLKSWLHLITPAISRGMRSASLVQDILSPLLSIVVPNMRPVASHLLSQQEREDLKQLVDTMISYGLRYKKNNSPVENRIVLEGYSLDPPLYEFVKFKEYSGKHLQLSYAIQQMLCHELEIEAIKRGRAAKDEAPAPVAVQRSSIVSETKTVVKTQTLVKQKESELVSITTKTTAVKTTKSVVRQANFFDRFRTESSKRDHSSSQSATAKRDSRPLLFKFHEGFTNAVKKPVLMKEFLS